MRDGKWGFQPFAVNIFDAKGEYNILYNLNPREKSGSKCVSLNLLGELFWSQKLRTAASRPSFVLVMANGPKKCISLMRRPRKFSIAPLAITETKEFFAFWRLRDVREASLLHPSAVKQLLQPKNSLLLSHSRKQNF
jgi:hypothetical protein